MWQMKMMDINLSIKIWVLKKKAKNILQLRMLYKRIISIFIVKKCYEVLLKTKLEFWHDRVRQGMYLYSRFKLSCILDQAEAKPQSLGLELWHAHDWVYGPVPYI